MQKRFLYVLFLCFALNGMSPAHAEPNSFLTTIKGYIASIKEYASAIYKNISSTNMLIGGATIAASALVVNYLYASKGYTKFQQQHSEKNESSTIPATHTSTQPPMTSIINIPPILEQKTNNQPTETSDLSEYNTILSDFKDARNHIKDKPASEANGKLMALKKMLQSNKNTLERFLPEQKKEICCEILKTANALRGEYLCESYIPSSDEDKYQKSIGKGYTEEYQDKTVNFKIFFKLVYDCAQLLNVSLPIENFVITSLIRNNTNIASSILQEYTLTKNAINTLLDHTKLGYPQCPDRFSILHELIRHHLNTLAKKIIACNANLNLKVNTLYEPVGLAHRDVEDKFYQTPLIFAVAYNNLAMVKLLLYLNRPSDQEITDAQSIANTRKNNSNPVDTQITELLNNPNTIATHITTDEKKEFDTINRQRGEPLLFKDPQVLYNGKIYPYDILIECQN